MPCHGCGSCCSLWRYTLLNFDIFPLLFFAFYYYFYIRVLNVSSFCISQFDITAPISILSRPVFLFLMLSSVWRREREGLRSMLVLCTQRPAAGGIGVIDQAQSIYSARLLGLCEWRLFLNYYRRQMLVRRCSLSRLQCHSALISFFFALSHFCFLHHFKVIYLRCFYFSPFLYLLRMLFVISHSTLLFYFMQLSFMPRGVFLTADICSTFQAPSVYCSSNGKLKMSSSKLT